MKLTIIGFLTDIEDCIMTETCIRDYDDGDGGGDDDDDDDDYDDNNNNNNNNRL
jgi:hypothetical protein